VIVVCCATAVEKVTILARLLSIDSMQNNQQIRTSIAHAACCLIGSLEDINLYVVQRTTLYLETIKVSSTKVLYMCTYVYLFSLLYIELLLSVP